MTQRLSISISESLYERLQKHKDNIKVSKICQQALEDVLIIEELKHEADVKKMTERLKIEKSNLLKYFKAEGIKDGMKDALEMDFQGLVAVEQYVPGKDDGNAPFFKFMSDRTNEKYNRIHYGMLVIEKVEDEDGVESWCLFEHDGNALPGASDAYWGGWNEGVVKIWKKVKNNI